MAGAEENIEHQSDGELENEIEDDESLIKYYFFRGLSYNEIRLFLFENHGKQMNISTLKRRIDSYGLRQRQPDYDLQLVQEEIQKIVDGPGCLQGYRSVWHSLQLKGITVPRGVVEQLLREIDPEGTKLRKAHRLRSYHNPGPNHLWHYDGYDKLKPFGFPVHGCIDGWSRKILWMHVTCSNNQPNNIAAYYLDTIQELGGCPVLLITDLRTENGHAAAIQCFFRNNDSHKYVPSPRNQRIESWWAQFRKSDSTWWINFFKDLVDEHAFDTSSILDMECIWFCFSELLQRNIDEFKVHWNTHFIRKSRHDTVSGRPDSLYFLPEIHGGEPNLILPVERDEVEYVQSHIVDNSEKNE